MSMFDAFGRAVNDVAGKVAEGDLEGAAEAASDGVGDVVDGAIDDAEAVTEAVDDAGNAVDEATGGLAGWDVDSDGLTGHVGGAAGRVDVAATDDGQAGVDVGWRTADEDGRTTSFTGATVNYDVSDRQTGLEAGVFQETPSQAGGPIRSEAGVFVGADASPGQGGVEGGVFIEGAQASMFDSETTDLEDRLDRVEGGLTLNLDGSRGGAGSEQVGVDGGLYVESEDRQGRETRAEAGLTGNADIGGSGGGTDVGGFVEVTDEREGDDLDIRAEAGLTFGVHQGQADPDASGDAHAGVGWYQEGTKDGVDTVREQIIVGVGADEDGAQVGGFVDHVRRDEDGDAGTDRYGSEAGIRIGAEDGIVYGGVFTDTDEMNQPGDDGDQPGVEAGISLDTTTGEVGIYRENDEGHVDLGEPDGIDQPEDRGPVVRLPDPTDTDDPLRDRSLDAEREKSETDAQQKTADPALELDDIGLLPTEHPAGAAAVPIEVPDVDDGFGTGVDPLAIGELKETPDRASDGLAMKARDEVDYAAGAKKSEYVEQQRLAEDLRTGAGTPDELAAAGVKRADRDALDVDESPLEELTKQPETVESRAEARHMPEGDATDGRTPADDRRPDDIDVDG